MENTAHVGDNFFASGWTSQSSLKLTVEEVKQTFGINGTPPHTALRSCHAKGSTVEMSSRVLKYRKIF